MKKIPKREYTAEFKDQAVKRVQAVGAGPAAKELGMVEQTLRNGFKASQAGTLAGAGSKPGALVRPVKYAWMQLERRQFPLPEMCRVLDVSISGFRAWLRGGTPGSTRLSDVQAVAVIKTIRAEVRGACGLRRMHANCRAEAIRWA
jgi:hypothetical protein